MLIALLLVAAQDRSAVDLAETIVTAPRATQTVTTTDANLTVVSGEELRATGERTLPQALGRASGVWIQETNLGGGSPVIRGLVGNQIAILVDGVRLNDSTTRLGPNQSLNTIDPFIVERIEIVRGARSLLYGSDAIGGAILIWTRRRAPLARDPAHKQLAGTLEGIYDSASEGFVGSASGSLGLEDHGLLFIGGFHDYGDLSTGRGDVPFTGYGGNSFFGSWEVALGPKRTLRATGRAHRDFDVPRTDRLVTGFGQSEPSNELFHFALQDRRAYQLTYGESGGEGWFDRMQLRLSVRTYEERRDIQATGSSTRRYEEDDVRTVGLGADWQKALGSAHLLTFGVDFESDDVDSFRRDTNLVTEETVPQPGAFAPGSRYTSYGVFVQDEIFSFDPWFLTLGVRYSFHDFAFRDESSGERESGDFDALVLSAEAARELAPGLTLTAGVAQGFRAPNLEDLSKEGSFASGTELGNPDLDPERSLSGELGLAARKDGWNAGVATFVTHIDDLIGRRLLDEGDPDVVGDETYLRDNAGRALMWGAEATLGVQLVREDWPLRLETSAAWVRGRQYDGTVDPATGEAPFDGVHMRRIPPLHGRAGLRYEGLQTWNHVDWATLYVQWAARQDRLHPQDVSDPRIDPDGTPGWATLNFDFGGPFTKDATWTVGLRNLLDKRYRVHSSGFDAPGVALVVGLHASF